MTIQVRLGRTMSKKMAWLHRRERAMAHNSISILRPQTQTGSEREREQRARKEGSTVYPTKEREDAAYLHFIN